MLGITRETKRLIIIVIFLLVLIVSSVAVYFLWKPSPTCFDKIQNQDEGGIDCGGMCAQSCVEVINGVPLQAKDMTILPSSSGIYDLVAAVTNANGEEIGASHFRYTFVSRDPSGKETVLNEGVSWILPNETKNLIAFNIASPAKPEGVDLRISETEWQRLTDYRGKPNLNVYRKRYNEITSGVGFSEAFGVLSNESPYDFRNVSVKFILRDTSGTPLAVQQRLESRLTSGEQRDIHVIWPTAFPGSVTSVDTEVDADVYHSSNFVNQYFPGGHFQERFPSR